MGVPDPRLNPYGDPPRRPRVRLSAIGEGWELFKAEWLTWVVIALIVMLCNAVVFGAVHGFTGRRLPAGGGGFHVQVPPVGQVLDVVLGSILNGFFLGGMFRTACLQIRGRRPKVSDLFELSNVLNELVIGSALYALICFAAAFLLVLPAFIASGVLMFTIPLIVDGRLKAVDALRTSWLALKDQWLAATVFHLLVNFATALGGCCCFVGLLFTMPLYSLSVAVLYRDFFLARPTVRVDKPTTLDPDF